MYTVITGDQSDLINNPPSVTVKFEDRSTTGNTFDLAIADFYQVAFGDSSGANPEVDDVETVTDPTEEQCLETWWFSEYALACVMMEGAVKRIRNTGDNVNDITLDF